MMNVLIVDDEIYVVRALQKKIDWAALGIENAWIAFNAAKAREILEKKEINILVTDIEMPGESGLDLAEWVNGRCPDCKVIFLTSHAEFTYAQRAMHCHAMDYVLKPLDFDSFAGLMARAVSEIRDERARHEREKHGEQWEDVSSDLQQSFWSHLLVDGTAETPDNIQKKAEAYGVNVDFTITYQVFLLVPRNIPGDNRLPEGRHRMEEFISNLAEDILRADLLEVNYGWIYHHFWVIVPAACMSTAVDLMANLASLCMEMAQTGVVVYFDQECYLEELGGMLRKLTELDKSNVSVMQGVYTPKSLNETAGFEKSFFSDVRSLLMARQYNALEKYIGNREQLQLDKGIDSESLYFASLRFSYEIIRHLEQIGMKLEDIYTGEIIGKKESSLHDLKTFFEQMKMIAKRLGTVCRESDTEPDSVTAAKRYIQDHICERIRREDIAENTNFSADYIARIFKAAVGKSLNEYIMEQKMIYACQLMKETDRNVGDIASEVGYSSFSYFTEIFKRFIGCLPSEYRR